MTGRFGANAPLRLSCLFLLAAAAALVIACGGGKGGSAAPADPPTAPAASTPSGAPSPSVAPSIPQATLNLFYPEFAASRLGVRGSFSPSLGTRIPTTVFNLTDRELQTAAVQTIFRLVDDLSRARQVLPGFENVPNTNIVIRRRGGATITMVLIPDSAVKPRSTVSDFIRTRNPPAASAFGRNGDVFSYVAVGPGLFSDGSFGGVADFATFNFGVEVCQEVLQVVVVDQRGAALTDATLNTDAQEFVCNSLGGAIAARALGLPYDVYEAFVQSHPIRITNGHVEALEVDEETYDSYPQTGPVLE